jgi:hypothetical protein
VTDLEAALVAAGFLGVEREGAVIFARDGAEAPEFTVEGRVFAQRFPLRADEADRAAWMRAHPAGRLEIAEGETRLVMVLPEGADPAAGMEVWRGLMRAAAWAAVGWRRRERPLHGM